MPDDQKEWSDAKLLMHFWRFPSVHVADVEECICDPKDNSKLKQHIIIKIVPLQIPERLDNIMRKLIKKKVREFNIQNKIEHQIACATRPWVQDFRSPNYIAATRATIQVYIFNNFPVYVQKI